MCLDAMRVLVPTHRLRIDRTLGFETGLPADRARLAPRRTVP